MLGPAAIARWALATRAGHVTLEGLEHVPQAGPVLLVARHYHHLLDGAVILRWVPRPVHIIVGLDWTENARQRAWMERACRAAQYPVVLRPATLGTTAGYSRDELLRYTRRGIADAAALLHEGRVVLVFPEGYPNIDPASTQKSGDELLPFAAGWERVVTIAERNSNTHVAIVPVGFVYALETNGRWSVTARFGTPRRSTERTSIESDVRALSGMPEKTTAADPTGPTAVVTDIVRS
jgi:1-acyl-sn-glycerol-3-phosphate acyltransferase